MELLLKLTSEQKRELLEQLRLNRAEEICQKMVELEQELKGLGFELKYNTNGYSESNYKKFAKLDKRDKKIKIFIQG